jgi:hypothetical protein
VATAPTASVRQCARSVRSRLAAALSDPLAAAGVKKALIRVPVRRPSPQKFIRVHAGEDLRDDREADRRRIARSGRGRQSALDGERKSSGREDGG